MTFRYLLAASFALFTGACAHRQGVIEKAPTRAWLEVNISESGLATLRIKNSEGEIIREVLRDSLVGAGSKRIAWDGLDASGRAVGPGSYGWDLELRQVSFEFDKEMAGPGSAKGQVLHPAGLAVSEGRDGPILHIADAGNRRVQSLGPNGEFLGEIRPTGQEQGAMVDPWGLAQRGGELAVADRDARRVARFGRHGQWLGAREAFGPHREKLEGPTGVAFDPFGNLIITDNGSDRVLIVDASGRLAFTLGGFGSGDGFLVKPLAACSDPQGNIFISDTGNGRMQKFSISGHWLKTFTLGQSHESLFAPGQAVFSGGLLVVADTLSHRVAIWDAEGSLLALIDLGSRMSGIVSGLALSSDGQLFLADGQGHRVYRFMRRDRVSQQAGLVQLDAP